MKNVWKGLVVGGLTGVTAGAVLDSFNRASKTALAIGEQVRKRAPEGGRWLQSTTDKAAEWIHDTDVSGHARSAAHRVAESDVAKHVKQAGDDVKAAATRVAN